MSARGWRTAPAAPIWAGPQVPPLTSMPPIISINNLSKTYATGFRALNNINLDIRRGEIFALLGPNGAGKTTLIGIVCGIVRPSAGKVTVGGHDILSDYRAARSLIGLVPQELHTDAFESVWATVIVQPRPVQQAAQSRLYRKGAAVAVALGQEGRHAS